MTSTFLYFLIHRKKSRSAYRKLSRRAVFRSAAAFHFFALPIKLSAFPQEIPETAAYTAPLLHWLDGARLLVHLYHSH